MLATTTTTVAPTSTSSSSSSSVASSVPSSSSSTLPDTVATTAPAPPPTTAAPAPGDPIARLEAPKIGLNWIVVNGVGVDDLKKGPGHYPDTPLPGHIGNVGIAGHRTTFGHPFFRINELEPGDDVILTTATGRYVYKVTEQFIVSPSQSEVLAPTPDAELTLTSCHPRYSARKRIIIKAKLDAAASSPLAPTAPPPTVAPTTVAPSTIAPTTAAPQSAASTTTSAASAPPATTAAALAPTPPSVADQPIAGDTPDALEKGWFADSSAWGPVVCWGLLVVACSLLGWGLRRWTGRRWVGVIAAVAPFVVCLYFFFENVNRLLPPNI